MTREQFCELRKQMLDGDTKGGAWLILMGPTKEPGEGYFTCHRIRDCQPNDVNPEDVRLLAASAWISNLSDPLVTGSTMPPTVVWILDATMEHLWAWYEIEVGETGLDMELKTEIHPAEPRVLSPEFEWDGVM